MIERYGPLSLSRQCALQGVSRSSQYYRPKGESAENLALMRRMDDLHMEQHMVKANFMTPAFLKRVRSRADGDTYGTQALRELAEITAQQVDEWKTAGKPTDKRALLADMVEACRVSFFEVDRLLQNARRGAPGWAQAERDLLAARRALWPLLDDF